MKSINEFVINGKNLTNILDDHKKWLSEPAGQEIHPRADLSDADLSGADLSDADLSDADLSGANLRSANLSYADLSDADLSDADLSDANLSGADLSGANLRSANLSYADLSDADLSYANLSDADLSGANLSYANLSDVKNLLNPVIWLSENFETDELGYIVYKAIGGTPYSKPDYWNIEPGSKLEEVANPLPTNECACGVNFATLKWVKENHLESDIWRCRIRWLDLPGVVVPYNTDGKARCSRLELIEVIS